MSEAPDLDGLKHQPFALLDQMGRVLSVSRRSVAKLSPGDDTWQGLAFRVRDQWLVCRSSEVKEYRTVPTLTRAPGAKPWFAGMANLRGTLLPVTDLAKFLDLSVADESGDRQVIVVKADPLPVGIIVDEIAGYRRFTPDDEVDDAPIQDAFSAGQIGVMHREGRDWLAFSLQKLIRCERFNRAGA